MEDGESESSGDKDRSHSERVGTSADSQSAVESSSVEPSNHGTSPTSSRPASSASNELPLSIDSRTQIEPGSKPTSRSLLTNAYRDLLNATINSARCDDIHEGELQDSAIGYSYWTSSEKEALFGRLSRCASGDLRTLSRAVATKSESEVFMYLKLLRDCSSESHASSSPKNLGGALVDAAWEISSECEDTVGAAADVLARHISKHDSLTEQARYGNDWLLSQDSASLIDRQYEEREIARSLKVEADTGDVMDATLLTDEAPSNAPELPLPPADELLRPSEFLGLARTVFMNSAEADSWHTMEDIIGPCQEPAIYRSALEEIHELAVAFTRRLCLTALTQAASRLRSQAADHPVAIVSAGDVRTACDILNVPSKRDEFWATCPRRCRLKIYSNSDKYKDGRDTFYPPGSHHPARLISYAEAEKELRSEHHAKVQCDDESEVEPDDDDLEAALNGEDFFTDASISSNDEMELEAESQRGCGINDATKGMRPRPMTQRKYLRLEERNLDAVDSQSSREEVQRLWELLRRRPSESASVRTSTLKSMPRAPLDLDLQSVEWRQKMKWVVPWEHEQALPDIRAFWKTERRGRARRKHREALKKMLQDRLTEHRVEESGRADTTTNEGSSANDRNLVEGT